MRLFLEELLIGFELKNFFIAVIVLFIVYLAWESTYVPDYRPPNSVLLIGTGPTRLVDVNPNGRRDGPSGTGQPASSARENSEVEGDRNSSNLAAENIPEPPPSLDVVIEEVHNLGTARHAIRFLESYEESIRRTFDGDDYPERLIHAMDSTDGFESRHLIPPRNQNNTNASAMPETSATASTSSVLGGGDTAGTTARNTNCDAKSEQDNGSSQPKIGLKKNDEFTIKLMYTNEDTKLVKCSPRLKIGDFKKRFFATELREQKFIRLVFNGQLLNVDSNTLQQQGFFDKCVVHCWIFNRNPYLPPNYRTSQTTIGSGLPLEPDHPAEDTALSDESAGNTFIHEPNNHSMALYASIAFVTLLLILCWYCRIQYHFFFCWYSTLALTLVTIICSILGPMLVLIDNIEVQPTT